MKNMFIIAFAAFCISLSAAVQYNIDWNGIYVNEDSTITVKFTNNSLFKDFNVFGYYLNGDISGEFSIDSAKDKEFELGNFSSGDTIGFFVVQNGIYYNNFGIHDRYNGHYGLETWTDDWSKYAQFDIKISSKSYDNPSTTSGQPLPGELASLVIGGASLIIRRKLKKNA